MKGLPDQIYVYQSGVSADGVAVYAIATAVDDIPQTDNTGAGVGLYSLDKVMTLTIERKLK